MIVTQSQVHCTSFEHGSHERDEQIEHDDDGEDVIDAEIDSADPLGRERSMRGEVEVVLHVCW